MQLTKLNNGNYQLTIELTPEVINGLLMQPLEMSNSKPVDKLFGMQNKTKELIIELFKIFKSNIVYFKNDKVQELKFKYKVHDMTKLFLKLEGLGLCKIVRHSNNRILTFQLFL